MNRKDKCLAAITFLEGIQIDIKNFVALLGKDVIVTPAIANRLTLLLFNIDYVIEEIEKLNSEGE